MYRHRRNNDGKMQQALGSCSIATAKDAMNKKQIYEAPSSTSYDVIRSPNTKTTVVLLPD
jgi:hypothetical protein